MKTRLLRGLVVLLTFAAIGYMSVSVKAASSGTWSTDDSSGDKKSSGGCGC